MGDILTMSAITDTPIPPLSQIMVIITGAVQSKMVPHFECIPCKRTLLAATNEDFTPDMAMSMLKGGCPDRIELWDIGIFIARTLSSAAECADRFPSIFDKNGMVRLTRKPMGTPVLIRAHGIDWFMTIDNRTILCGERAGSHFTWLLHDDRATCSMIRAREHRLPLWVSITFSSIVFIASCTLESLLSRDFVHLTSHSIASSYHRLFSQDPALCSGALLIFRYQYMINCRHLKYSAFKFQYRYSSNVDFGP